MTGPFTLAQVDESVTRSHSDGVTDLAAAALIEHDAKFLLVRTATRDLDTPPAWDLPAGPVLPGETVVDGLHRILAQALGYSNTKITAFFGIVDADNGTRTFVFSTTVDQPDSVCWASDIPHRWIDNITISDLVPEINHVLRAYRGWMRVYAHMPDHGAHTRQATCLIGGTDSTSPYRVHPQRVLENKWVDLGVFNFTGPPTVSLDSDTQDGTGDEDIAWDSVAFQPLSAKPKNFVVAMGDSYSSGEGATEPGGKDYYAESDYYDKAEPKSKNSCHRSKIAWSRQATLPGSSKSIGALADSRDANMDYHFIACSGARTFNILNTGRSGELAQLKQGYLDQNTSLVTLSVGGNDARFTDIVKKCVLPTIWNCQAESLDNIDPDNGEKTGGDTGGLDEWAPKWLHEQIRPRITATLKTIHDKAPNAEIVLMGYPRLLEDNGSCVLGMEDVEGKWVNSVADILADEMKGAVDDANSQYKAKAVLSDPRGVFTGKAVCGDPESVHGIVISGQAKADNDLPKPSMQSFHPKPAGARLYADSLEKTLKDE